MEWNNRGPSTPPNNANLNTNPNSSNGGTPPNKSFSPPFKKAPRNSSPRGSDRSWRIASVVLLFTITLLAVSVIAYLAFFRPSITKQSEFVDKTKFQAVFLNGGQVYFGRITAVNSNYIKLNDIYYLRVNQQVQPNGSTANGDVQLVKLGCELHGPQDQMVINSEQVIFWENLKDDGQVVKAITKYVSENPDGQKCENQTSDNNNSGNQENQNQQNNNTTPENTNTTTPEATPAPATP
jgi:hypothetical protein